MGETVGVSDFDSVILAVMDTVSDDGTNCRQ